MATCLDLESKMKHIQLTLRVNKECYWVYEKCFWPYEIVRFESYTV